jgi:hypothetical protein
MVEKIINKNLKNLKKLLSKRRMVLAPQKYNYIVFTNDSKKQHQNLSLKLFKNNLTLNENPTFLGIRFESSLNFEKPI